MPNVVVAISAFWVASQFYVSRRDYHVGQSLAYEQRFDGDHLALRQAELSQVAAQAIAQVSAQIGHRQFSTAPERSGIHDGLLVRYVMQREGKVADDIPASLNEIVGFFDSLQVCVEQRLCDRTTAHAFFDGYANDLWKTFGPVIAYERRSQRPEFAKALQRYIGDIPGASR